MSSGDVFGLTNAPSFLPKYHGDEGDIRYLSPRRLRSMGAGSVDFVLMFGLVLFPLLTLGEQGEILSSYDYLLIVVPVVVIVGNRFLLPKWAHASVGELIFGLIRIRGNDGTWPGWRDLWWSQWTRRDEVPIIVRVRRCDIRSRDRASGR